MHPAPRFLVLWVLLAAWQGALWADHRESAHPRLEVPPPCSLAPRVLALVPDGWAFFWIALRGGDPAQRLLLDLDLPLQAVLFADGSPCGHLPCSPWGAAFEPQCERSPVTDCPCGTTGDPACALDPSQWHLLFIEYRPWEPSPAVTFCLDGRPLASGAPTALLAALRQAFGRATRPLRLRVSAKPETGGRAQTVEVDWFALQGLSYGVSRKIRVSGTCRAIPSTSP